MPMSSSSIVTSVPYKFQVEGKVMGTRSIWCVCNLPIKKQRIGYVMLTACFFTRSPQEEECIFMNVQNFKESLLFIIKLELASLNI